MTISIEFGALAPSIKSQLLKQGVTIDPAAAERFEKVAYSIVFLHLHGIITDSVRDNGRKKLMKMISNEIHKRDSP